MTQRPTEIRVPVAGGELACHHWQLSGSEGIPVIALHGITANGRAWDAFAHSGRAGSEASLSPAGPVADLFAPDLRGRADSAQLPGPYGLSAHVDDVLALLDHLDRPRAVLVGHSMGAFVAALAAARHPDRFPRVVLVDGGVGFPPPPGADIDAQLDAVLGPAVRRLTMTFPDPESYRDFFRAHPALAEHWGPDIAAYVDHDLVADGGAFRSSCVPDAVRADGADVLCHDETLAAARQPQVDGVLLWAERGLLDDDRALYEADRLAGAGLDNARLPQRRIDDTNHYTVLFAPHALAHLVTATHHALDLLRD
ncbi:alpha/beta hydrolase [Streptomyces sp. XM4193]|uniref:alpha/beta fold hydrolase n=1 Tax=Streptomyces sp. XM4193 TaxID=2929782 RepID=UPI001FFA8C43|nr:alpha/beta hydrolase [Streptomyces sp. XM4193]MCK1798407.1 alpha/beta hydrolase [Streptomyces sp. XM4193]